MAEDRIWLGDFRGESIRHLQREYLPRLEVAVRTLPVNQLWWRPHEATTSVGNLLLHLEGNVGQWILAGVAGREDRRNRDAEFSAQDGSESRALLGALGQTVGEACEVIAQLSDEDLERELAIQSFRVNVQAAVYHVVEHFSWHSGQICWMAKALAGPGHGIDFYRGLKLD